MRSSRNASIEVTAKAWPRGSFNPSRKLTKLVDVPKPPKPRMKTLS